MSEALIGIDDREVFAAYFDQKPFHVRHGLAGHPLIPRDRLF